LLYFIGCSNPPDFRELLLCCAVDRANPSVVLVNSYAIIWHGCRSWKYGLEERNEG